jgi:DNA-binding NarL/FixJ family response regulator
VVGVASTIAEATRLVGALDPDVCLVDIDLGSESGFELARQIATGENHSPHVILISAYPGRDFTDMIAESPAIGFLSKPELSAARVRAIVAGHESGESQPG